VIKQAVILVGGRGERLNDKIRFTPAIETPKPLVEVGGRPFIYYAIRYLTGIGFDDIVLLVGYKKEIFSFLETNIVRLVETQDNVDKAVLGIPNLDDMFVLLNGDCLPVMDFNILKNRTSPCTTIKIIGRDAGCAVVAKKDIESGLVSCGNILDMENVYESIMIWGGLHIGTMAGLQRARQFADIIMYGA
jgi:GTP:adenosylcobinamide-phosphate guanylyltransferase